MPDTLTGHAGQIAVAVAGARGAEAMTAGPGVTNNVSAVTTAHFNGSPWLSWVAAHR